MIVRLRNPTAVQLPAIRRLFQAALTRGSLDPEYAIDRRAASCQDPRIGIFIGLEAGEPKGMITACLPADPRIDHPLFDLGTNFGSRALGDELRRTAVEFLRQAGYHRALTFNQTGHSDAVYIRNARRYGTAVRPWCSVLEVDLDKEEDPENGRRSIEK